MIRGLFKLIVLVVVVAGVGGYFLGWWSGRDILPEGGAVATAGRSTADRAKEAGAQIGQKAGEAAKEVGQAAKDALSDGALTAKIKAKMALDDSVNAREVNVDTVDGVVTVSGRLRSNKARDKALQLARETNGVRQVIDRTTVEGAR